MSQLIHSLTLFVTLKFAEPVIGQLLWTNEVILMILHSVCSLKTLKTQQEGAVFNGKCARSCIPSLMLSSS